jgi:hypothetical protein
MPKRIVEDALWNSHKATIEDLYMTKAIGLKEVMKTMRSQYGFDRRSVQYSILSGSIVCGVANSRRENQYTRNFRRWNWRRKFTKAEYEYIDQQVQKRESEGKLGDVLQIDGNLVSMETIQRGRKRHVFRSTIDIVRESKFMGWNFAPELTK